jgi:tetratricopeptide (TPR) repeat protein
MKLNSILFSQILLLAIVFLQACNSSTNSKSSIADKTLLAINEQLKTKPNDAGLYYHRGQYYQSVQKDSFAILDFIKAVELDSNNAKYYSTAANILFDKKDDRSIPYLKKALALNPNDITSLLKIAKIQFYAKNYPETFKSINTVLRIDVYNYDAYFLKGMCYKDMGDTVSAMSSFQTATRSNPDKADSYMQMAFLTTNKEPNVAIQYFENAFKADTNNVESLNGIGMIHQTAQQNDLAKKAFIRCITAKPGFAKAYYNIGCIAMDEDSMAKAERQFDIAIQHDPQYKEAFYNRGLCKEMKKDAEGALQDYEQALRFDADFKLALDGKKRVLQKVKI